MIKDVAILAGARLIMVDTARALLPSKGGYAKLEKLLKPA